MPYVPCWARHFVDTKFGHLLFAELVGGKWKAKNLEDYFQIFLVTFARKFEGLGYAKNTWNILKLSFDNLSLPWPLLLKNCLKNLQQSWGIFLKKCRSHFAHDWKNTKKTGLKFDAPDIWDPWQAPAGAQPKDLHDQPVPWRRESCWIRDGQHLWLMAKILRQLMWRTYHYLQGFIYPRWCKIFLHQQYVISNLNPCACRLHMSAWY